MKRILFPFALLFFAKIALAQPANDSCGAPIKLTDVTNFCSPVGAFTNANATPSGYGNAACMNNSSNDVWFSFVAQFTDVNIVIRGNSQISVGGSLNNPEVVLYLGICGGNITELECTADPSNFNIVELYKGGLFIGQTYLVRVQGAGGNEGTFQVCINNFNPPVDPKSDCPDAAILCDKSSFSVQKVSGFGVDGSEISDATCFSNGLPGNYETNSTWFSWTCSKSGPLTFNLTPANPGDDLDFVVYELPNGLANCSGKKLLRCMASGNFTIPSICMGPTGLKTGSTDVSEDSGCQTPGKDNYLKPLDMVQGVSYALVVNNFTSTGNSFAIEFGGTGEFLGPDASFTTIPSEVCLGIPIIFNDASTFPIGAITKWNWTFGIDATPQNAVGKGPHSIQFAEPGIHSIVLTLETDLGCKVTNVEQVLVHPPVEIDTVLSVPDCNGGTNGQIEVKNITSGTPPYLYSWDNGPFTTMNILSMLGISTHNLVIRDKNNCETAFEIDVKEKELAVAPDVIPPLCTGQSNGQIVLNVTNGTAPYLFNWGAQAGTGTTPRLNLPAGTYFVTASDAELCKGLFEIEVVDYLPVSVDIDTTNITCFGLIDGIGTAVPAGGVGNYNFVWNPTGQTTAVANELPQDNYFVTVTDGNGCTAVGSVYISEPPPLKLAILDVKNVLCYEDQNGAFYLDAMGGTPSYQYSTNGQDFIKSDSLTNLGGGRYVVFVKDSVGCLDSIITEIGRPPQLIVDAERDTTLELGNFMQVQTVVFPAFRAVEYGWTPIGGLSCSDCAEPIITPTESTIYTIKITDEDGCMAFDSLRVLVTKNRPIYIPNVIGPEKNSPNDRFTIFGNPGADEIEVLRVFDRWGNLLFENKKFPLNDPNLGWDATFRGKLVDSGVYAFYTKIHFIDGEVLLYEGDITVIRGRE
jgi:gliding motility-associated-like protein